MKELEHTIATARVLLDECTRMYRNQSVFSPGDILPVVHAKLKLYQLGTRFHADTWEYDIVTIEAAE